MNPLLRAEGIQVLLARRTVLAVPQIEVKGGEVFVAIGPNGAGKSTLLRVLAALQPPQRGKLFFRGRRVSWRRALAYRRRLAVVLQEPLLLSMSVFHNVALGLLLRGRRGRPVRQRVMYWLEQFQVAYLAERSALALSGGEAQRVALARAFAAEPEMLFLDEPFSGLDMPTRLAILADLRRVLQETGLTTFLVTHDRDEALALADRVAVLFEGRLAQVGPVEEVFMHPAHERIAAFVGVENRVPAHIVERASGRVRVRFPWGDEIEIAASVWWSGEALVCVRPEEIELLPGEPCEGGQVLRGQVVQSVPLGMQVRVEVAAAGVIWRVLLPRSHWRRLDLRERRSVCLRIPPDRAHLLPLQREGDEPPQGAAPEPRVV